MDTLDQKVYTHFQGKIVQKHLTGLLKRSANVPTFVLEYLLGMYCSTDDELKSEVNEEAQKMLLALFQWQLP